ncbi:MAG: HAMP domain-containing protein, partial [Acidimicrobiia bacterium]
GVGAVAISIPNSVLTDLVTSNGQWEETGLGETGEVYLVGEDGLLRTESRLFLEDPDAYLAAAAEAGYGAEMTEKVARFGTTVLIQPVDTEPVQVAREGDQFSGDASSYLGKPTLAVSSPIEPASLRWVVVTEVQQSEVFTPLYSYLRRLVVAGVVVSILVVVLAMASARWLLRPIDPIVEAASRVGEGDLTVVLPDAGRDEFAYLSGQLNLFVEELARRKAEVEATEAETSELLASVVPRRLVERVMAGNRDIAETISNASLIAFTVKGSTDNLGNLEFLAEQNAEVMSGLSSIAGQYGAEQLSSSAVTLLYATGLDVDEPRIEDAVEFAVRASAWLTDLLSERGYMLGVSVGIASGDMVAGVMGTERLTVDVIGAPRQIAGSLSQAAEQRQVLVDAEVASRLDESWAVDRVSDLEDVGGSPLDAWNVTKRISV